MVVTTQYSITKTNTLFEFNNYIRMLILKFITSLEFVKTSQRIKIIFKFDS